MPLDEALISDMALLSVLVLLPSPFALLFSPSLGSLERDQKPILMIGDAPPRARALSLSLSLSLSLCRRRPHE